VLQPNDFAWLATKATHALSFRPYPRTGATSLFFIWFYFRSFGNPDALTRLEIILFGACGTEKEAFWIPFYLSWFCTSRAT
jgi:hypothetical protein